MRFIDILGYQDLLNRSEGLDDFHPLESRRTDMPRIPVINTSHLDRIDELLVDNIDTGEFKLHRSVFTDEDSHYSNTAHVQDTFADEETSC